MIDAKDLRAGNMVTRDDGQVFRVTIQDLYLINEGKRTDVASYAPLTLHWLKRAKFRSIKHTGRYYWRINPITHDYLVVIGKNKDGYYFQNAGHPIKYVHDLQNLIKLLTGEELSFKELTLTTPPEHT